MKIKNFCEKHFPINLEKRINKLINYVPQKYLIGLDSIVIIDKIVRKKDTAGLYIPKNKNELPRIEIAIDTIFNKVPTILLYLPFYSNFMIANVLYHEIGHHYQFQYKSGIKKKEQEYYADKFCKKMLTRAFWWWSFVFFPLIPLIKLFRKIKDNSLKNQ